MQFIHDPSVPAICFAHEDQFGQAFDVVVTRRTYEMTGNGLVPLADQPPLTDTDLYLGALLESSVRIESELAPYKPRSDVIVNATAYAPGSSTARLVTTIVRVERQGDNGVVRVIDKSVRVTGPRWWRRRALPVRIAAAFVSAATLGLVKLRAWRMTRPAPFSALPVRYESAYGGQCRIDAAPAERDGLRRKIGAKFCLTEEQLRQHPDAGTRPAEPLAHVASEENPLGTGFCREWFVRARRIDRVPAPRIMPADAPLTNNALWRAMQGKFAPPAVGYGCVGRAWMPRRAQIGEIRMDADGDQDDCPRLPVDFDYGYWNAAPRDQQCEHLRGGERITLVNLCRASHPMAQRVANGDTVLSLTLPEAQPYLALMDDRERIGAKRMALDTVLIEPDEGIIVLTWRAVLPATILTHAQLRIAETALDQATLDALLKLQDVAPADDEELADAA